MPCFKGMRTLKDSCLWSFSKLVVWRSSACTSNKGSKRAHNYEKVDGGLLGRAQSRTVQIIFLIPSASFIFVSTSVTNVRNERSFCLPHMNTAITKNKAQMIVWSRGRAPKDSICSFHCDSLIQVCKVCRAAAASSSESMRAIMTDSDWAMSSLIDLSSE
jgi:hypothetical protein